MANSDPIVTKCGVCEMLRNSSGEAVLFENDLWQVRACDPPTAVPGWTLLISRRHVAGPAQFNELEVASFGPTTRHLHRVLLEVTGALRIYSAAMGESSLHFHAHLVPRYVSMPKAAKAWAVFDLQRAAAAQEIEVDELQAKRIASGFAAALKVSPPPKP